MTQTLCNILSDGHIQNLPMRNEPTPSHLNLVHTRRVTHYKWSHCCPVSWRITTTICRTADSTRLQQTSGLRSPLQTQHVYSKHQNCASHSASSTSLTCECSVNNSTLRHSQRIKHFAHLRVLCQYLNMRHSQRIKHFTSHRRDHTVNKDAGQVHQTEDLTRD